MSLQRRYTFEVLEDNTIQIHSSLQRWNSIIAVMSNDVIKYYHAIGGGEYGSQMQIGDEHLITPEVEVEVRRLFHAKALT